MSECSFRCIQRQDIPSILGLFKQAFPGRELTREYYSWQFFESPVAPGCSVIAEQNGEIVAHAGYTGRSAKIHGNPGLVFIKQTSMSDPKVRGTGIYSRLLSYSNKVLRQRGADLMLSYPNNQNHPIQILRDDYIDIYQIPCMIRAARETSQEKTGPEKAFHIARDLSFDVEFERLADETTDSASYCLIRDSRYLQWRYAKRPDIDYFVCEERSGGLLMGAAVLKFFPPDRMMVVEWFGTPEASTSGHLFSKLEDFADSKGFKIYIWQNVFQKARHKFLERRGYQLGEPIIYFGAFAIQGCPHGRGWQQYGNWFVSMGDVDVF